MARRVLLVGIAIAIGCAIAMPVHAYDDETTHPGLTDEMITLHNRIYPGDLITAEQRTWMLKGSVDEDIVPRSLNHLYDPVHHTGWSGIETGWLPTVVTRVAALVALLPDAPLANVDWIIADSVQQAYNRYGGNRSWQETLRAVARGDQKAAYSGLGSALHLVQDAGVPDHARDDTHVHSLDYITGDSGSPFEKYAERYKVGGIGIAQRMEANASRVPRFGSPRDYLADNAQYAADSFFSKDTIQDMRFSRPIVTREANGIAYGRTKDGKEVPLARRVSALIRGKSELKLGSGSEFDVVHEAQFKLMAERTLLLGVGMIRDFKDADRKAAEAPKASAVVISLAGEVNRALDTVAGWLGGTARTVASQSSRVYAWLVGALPSVAGGNPPTALEQKNTKPASEISTVTAKPSASAKATMTKVKNTTATVKAPAKTTPIKPTVKEVINCPVGGAAKLRINEVAWMGTAVSANDEWIELFNLEAEAVALEGWELVGSDGGLYIDLDEVVVPAGGYAVLERTDDSTVPTVIAKAIYTGALANTPSEGYALELHAAGCGVVDRIEAASGWPAGDAASRRTMELKAASTWQTSQNGGGTPGRANSAGYVEPPKELEKENEEKEEDEEKEVEDEQDEELVIDQGVVRISEVQAAGVDAADEFIELYNPGARAVSLEGWSLQYFAATETSQASKRDLPGIVVEAEGYALIGRELSNNENGYRGTTSLDYAHRSFALSGEGATVALVRGSTKVASTSDASVVDWVRYPRLGSYESYERAAYLGDICIDPRKGTPGEYQGNGCAQAVWYVRPHSEPQNRASLHEPRVVDETSTTTTSTGNGHETSTASSWIALSLDGYNESNDVPDWRAFILTREGEEAPLELSTATQLEPANGIGILFHYAACSGSEVMARIILVPLTPAACQNGGLLSGAYSGNFWEDGLVLARALASLIPGQVLQLVEYAFSGGRAGEQYFTRTSTSTFEVVGGQGEIPTAPSTLAVDASNLPKVTVAWQSAMDLDTVDAELEYEVRISPAGESGEWRDVGSVLNYEDDLTPGPYTVAVRARDGQGNLGPEALTDFVILEPKPAEQFEHPDVLHPGTGLVNFSRAVRLAGIAFWLVPGAGPYCCSNVVLQIRDSSGQVVVTAGAGRRHVDGEGDTEFRFAEPLELGAGSYGLEITRSEGGGNDFGLGGLNGAGDWNGTGALYIRYIVPE